MTTTPTAPLRTDAPGPRASPPAGARGAGFPRLVGVELRKAVDTRSARWLLAGVLLLAVVACAVAVGVAEPADTGFTGLLGLASLVVSILLPVVAVLTVTSEFTTRNLLLSAVLVPDRLRLGLAKVAAVALLSLGVTVATTAVAALMTLVSVAVGDPQDPWALQLAAVGGTALYLLVLSLIGVGLGLLLTSSALAIVTYFVVPTVLALLGALVQRLAEPLRWVDTSALEALTTAGEVPVTGEQWARMGVTTAVWVVLPLVGGLLRLHWRDVV